MLAEAYSEARLDLSKLDGDIRKVERKLAQAAKRMEQKLKLRVDLDTRVAEQKLRSFERDVNRTRERLSARSIQLDLKTDANTEAAARAGRNAREAAEAAFGDRPVTVTVDLNDRRFRVAYRRIQALLARLAQRRIKVTVDLDYDEDGFARLRDTIVKANEARRLKIDAEFDVDLESARAEVRAAREELRLLADQSSAASTVSITVELDGASAVLTELAAIQAALAALPRQVSVDVDTRGGVDEVVAGGVTNGISELIAGLEEAGVSIASALQSLDAAEGIFGRLLPQSVRDQLIEAARAANGTILQETRNSINKTQEQLKGVGEKLGSVVNTTGADDAVTDAAKVAAAVKAVPNEVTIRYTSNASEFFNDSFAEQLRAQADATDAAARTAAERTANQLLNERRARALQANAEYTRLVADGEREAQRLRDEVVLAFDDERRQRELTAEAKKLDAQLGQWRKYATAAAGIAEKLNANIGESDRRLRERLGEQRLEDRQLRITTFFEGLSRTIAQIATINRPLDDIERPRSVDVDTTSIPGAVRRLVASLGPVQRLLNGRDQRGASEWLDFTEPAAKAAEFFRTLPALADAAFTRVRAAGQGSATLDFTDAANRAQRFYRTLPVLASAAFTRLRSLSAGGQSGFDFDALGSDARRYFRTLPVQAAVAAQRVKPLLAKVFDFGKTAAVDIKLKGLPKFLRDSAAILAQKALIARDIDVKVDIDRPGLLTRGIGGLARGVGRIVSGIGSALAGAVGPLTKFGSAIGETLDGAQSRLTNFAGNITEGLGKAAGAISSAAGPIGTAITTIVGALAGPTLIGLLIGAISALAGPLIAGLGGLIGAGVATLGSAVVAGLAGGALPIAAIFLGPAKDEIGKIIEPLKDQLITAFEPVTNLIVGSIVPAFAQLGSELIPIAAEASRGFIEPIAESLYALAANPALADAITTLTAPIGEGLASIIDTFTKYVPLFTDIAMAIGPPVVDAINAILDLVFTLGAVFADDVAGAFQVIADLFEQVRPALASLGPILTPLVGLLGAVVQAFVDAAAGIEARVGPIGEVIDEIAAAVPQAVPGLIAFGQAFVELLPAVAALVRTLPLISGVILGIAAFTAGAAGVIVGIGTVFIKIFGGIIDYGLAGLARLADGAAIIARFLGDAESADELSGFADTVDGWREGVRGFGNDAVAATESTFGLANTLGNAADVGFGFEDAMGGVADQTAKGAKSIAQLEAEARSGAITMVEFTEATGTAANAGVRSLAGSVDDLIKRLDEGELALSNFADTAAIELPSAADFVEEVADPRQAAREQRDQQRRLRDLQRQTQRDSQDIARAAQDYQDAIKEAAEVRQEAPQKYEWGANNFNAVLFEDSVKRQEEYDKQLQDTERAIQDRARALEDAQIRQGDNQIALADALSDQALGDPSDITTKVIDINKALSEGFAQIRAEADKARTLLQISSMGPEFASFADDFLAGLDPELFASAIAQLGGVGSEAFRAQAKQWADTVAEGDVTLETAFAKRRDAIAEESQRLDRLIQLNDLGLTSLITSLEGFDAATFNDIYDGLIAQGGEAGLRLANETAATLDTKATELRDRAEKLGLSLGEGAAEGVGKGGEELNAAISKAFGEGVTTTDGKRFGSIDSAVANSQGLSSSDLGGQAEVGAREQGVAIGEAITSGVLDALDNESGNLAEATATLLDSLDPEVFAVAGQTSAEKFYDGLESAFRNETNRAFALAAIGGFELSLRLRGSEYETIGDAWGGAVIAGIVNGVNADAVTLGPAFDLLSNSIATDSITEAWTAAGDTLGRAVMNGIETGIAESREFLSARLGVVRLGVTLQAELWAEAGDALGAAVVAGIADGIAADWQTVLTAIGLYAADVGRQTGPWADAGEELGGELADGIANGLTASRQSLVDAVGAALADENLRGASADQGELIGRALGAGIQRGLLLGLPVMLATATIVTDAIAAVMRARLGISSPSKVTATIGAQLTQGLVNGIESGRSAVLASASTLASELTDVLSQTAVTPRPGPIDMLDEWMAYTEKPLAGGTGTLQTSLDGKWFRLVDSLLMGTTDWIENEVIGARSASAAGGIGSGVGAQLPQRVDAVAQEAVYNRSTNTSSMQERTVVEETTINVYGVQDGLLAADEVARRQRDRRFLRGRQ